MVDLKNYTVNSAILSHLVPSGSLRVLLARTAVLTFPVIRFVLGSRKRAAFCTQHVFFTQALGLPAILIITGKLDKYGQALVQFPSVHAANPS